MPDRAFIEYARKSYSLVENKFHGSILIRAINSLLPEPGVLYLISLTWQYGIVLTEFPGQRGIQVSNR